MKFAIVYLQSATSSLKNGFKFFDDTMLHDDPVYNI